MPDAFFSSNKPRKRKRTEGPKDAGSARKVARKSPTQKAFNKPDGRANGVTRKKARADEELSDESDGGGGGIEDLDLRPDDDIDPGASGDEDDDETPAEKRLRLARLYLDTVKESLADGEFDAAEIDREIISSRLKQDVLENSGKIHLYIADSYDFSEPLTTILRTRGHRFSVTSAVAAESGKYLFTSGKEGSIIKWDLSSGKRIATFHKQRPPKADSKGKKKATSEELKGHTDEVWALAVSSDGRYVASGGKDRRLVVWDAEKGEWIKSFHGTFAHRDHISSLSFRKGSYQLYSASFDRSIKVYDLSPSVMGYVETLFGHQDHVLGIDSLKGETCVSVGARDTTVRYWKIVDETQLVFRGGGRSRIREVLEGGLRGDESGDEMDDEAGGAKRKEKFKETKYVEGSLECVSMVDEQTFVSGGDSGSISLWITAKKKPVFTQPLAHGLNEAPSETEGVIRTPRYITSLACLRYSDLFASGSWEGDIRLWKLDPKLKGFSLIGTVPAPGFVNSLQFISPPKEFFQSAPWTTPKDAQSQSVEPPTNGVVSTKPKAIQAPSLLLVAGLGQEPRLGRWMTLKEGVVNGTVVVAISPRRS